MLEFLLKILLVLTPVLMAVTWLSWDLSKGKKVSLWSLWYRSLWGMLRLSLAVILIRFMSVWLFHYFMLTFNSLSKYAGLSYDPYKSYLIKSASDMSFCSFYLKILADTPMPTSCDVAFLDKVSFECFSIGFTFFVGYYEIWILLGFFTLYILRYGLDLDIRLFLRLLCTKPIYVIIGLLPPFVYLFSFLVLFKELPITILELLSFFYERFAILTFCLFFLFHLWFNIKIIFFVLNYKPTSFLRFFFLSVFFLFCLTVFHDNFYLMIRLQKYACLPLFSGLYLNETSSVFFDCDEIYFYDIFLGFGLYKTFCSTDYLDLANKKDVESSIKKEIGLRRTKSAPAIMSLEHSSKSAQIPSNIDTCIKDQIINNEPEPGSGNSVSSQSSAEFFVPEEVLSDLPLEYREQLQVDIREYTPFFNFPNLSSVEQKEGEVLFPNPLQKSYDLSRIAEQGDEAFVRARAKSLELFKGDLQKASLYYRDVSFLQEYSTKLSSSINTIENQMEDCSTLRKNLQNDGKSQSVNVLSSVMSYGNRYWHAQLGDGLGKLNEFRIEQTLSEAGCGLSDHNLRVGVISTLRAEKIVVDGLMYQKKQEPLYKFHQFFRERFSSVS